MSIDCKRVINCLNDILINEFFILEMSAGKSDRRLSMTDNEHEQIMEKKEDVNDDRRSTNPGMRFLFFFLLFQLIEYIF